MVEDWELFSVLPELFVNAFELFVDTLLYNIYVPCAPNVLLAGML